MPQVVLSWKTSSFMPSRWDSFGLFASSSIDCRVSIRHMSAEQMSAFWKPSPWWQPGSLPIWAASLSFNKFSGEEKPSEHGWVYLSLRGSWLLPLYLHVFKSLKQFVFLRLWKVCSRLISLGTKWSFRYLRYDVIHSSGNDGKVFDIHLGEELDHICNFVEHRASEFPVKRCFLLR